jgi:hypothetical protein
MCARGAAIGVLTLSLGWAAPSPATSQTGRGKPPQAQAPAATGSGTIAGVITSDADQAPLARARVVLGSTALPQRRVALTDSRGAYAFEALPAGEYELTATRTGYVVPHAAGGPTRPLRVTLAGGARSAVNVALERAGTIPGRILDEDGSALTGVDVQALSLRGAEGQPLTAITSTRTDDRGEFRLAGLPSGQYLVVARDPAFVDVGDASGALRYAPTFHPGVLSSSDAQPVTVGAGQEAARVEFRLQIVRPARLSGSIWTPERRPLASGAIVLIARNSITNTPLLAEDVEFLPDGRFTVRNVPPGQYQLRVRAETDRTLPFWFASFMVTVAGSDVDGIQMVLTPGVVVRGTLEWIPPERRPRTLAGMRVRAPLADGTSFGDSLTGEIAADGSFRIRGVMTGRHYFTVDGLPEPFVVSAVVHQGRNVIDLPSEVAETQAPDLRIVVAAGGGELHGSVREPGGGPARDALIVTTAPPSIPPSTANPRFRTTRTDGEGRFHLRGLPAGAYRIAAVAGLDEFIAMRREWLDRIVRRGTDLTVAPNGRQTLDLAVLHGHTLTTPASR